ncbi:MAG: GbsR/MarR family transcriptional regulator [Phycisphaerales bacterium]
MSPDDDRDANFTRLRETQDRFIALWGDMGSHWGVPRSMAEIHALLFIVGEPLSADEIMERLRVSRGNVSMTLRSLVEWGIVSRSHRREDLRKRREIDPLLESLRGCELEGSPSKATAERDSIAEHNDRVRRMVDMISSVDQLADRLIGPAGPSSEDLESLVRGLAELPQ